MKKKTNEVKKNKEIEKAIYDSIIYGTGFIKIEHIPIKKVIRKKCLKKKPRGKK